MTPKDEILSSIYKFHFCRIDENLICVKKNELFSLQIIWPGFGIHEEGDPQDDSDYEVDIKYCPMCGY